MLITHNMQQILSVKSLSMFLQTIQSQMEMVSTLACQHDFTNINSVNFKCAKVSR